MKLLSFLIALTLCFALCACGNQNTNQTADPTENAAGNSTDSTAATDPGEATADSTEDPFGSLPSDFSEIELPIDEFPEDDDGPAPSAVITEPPEPTEPTEPTAPPETEPSTSWTTDIDDLPWHTFPEED